MNDRPTSGALTVADYPGEVVRIACDRCDRRGQYRRSTLATLFGKTATLPDVLNDLARCPRAKNASERCGAYYPDLAMTAGVAAAAGDRAGNG
jgi:hypothetical protein